MGANAVRTCIWCGQEIQRTPSGWMETRWRPGMSASLFRTCTKTPAANPVHQPALLTDSDFAAAKEAILRERNQAIAAAHEREMRELENHKAVYGQWHQGTCKGCGLDDLEVIGLPGSEYCRYCEELRVLKPPTPVVQPPAQLVPPVHGGRMLISLICAIAGLLLTFSDAPMLLCISLFAISFVMGKTA